MLRMVLQYENVVVLDGNLPDDAVLETFSQKNIIAVDGAALRLIGRGISPNFIIGDLDTIGEREIKSDCKIIQIIDENMTDFEKALAFVKERNMLPIIVLGMNGGELDHIYGNLNYLVKHDLGEPIIVDSYKDSYKLGTIVNDEMIIDVNIGANISIFPLPESKISTTGLKWDLDERKLSLFEFISLRNQAASSRVKVKVHSGKILVIVNYESILST
jgi:thiamine pyrophosphokinase